jgi:phosphoglycolate phosphatase-like HAD superfamily hydrolase
MLALQRARPGALTVPPKAPATTLCALSLHSTQLLFPSRRSSTTRCRAMADSVTQPLPHLARVRGVLFDIDGTLTNSDPLHFQACVTAIGYEREQPLRLCWATTSAAVCRCPLGPRCMRVTLLHTAVAVPPPSTAAACHCCRRFQELLVEAGFNNGIPIDDIFYNERISGRHNPEIAADLFPEWPEQERTAFYTAKEERFRKLAGVQSLKTRGVADMPAAEGMADAQTAMQPPPPHHVNYTLSTTPCRQPIESHSRTD